MNFFTYRAITPFEWDKIYNLLKEKKNWMKYQDIDSLWLEKWKEKFLNLQKTNRLYTLGAFDSEENLKSFMSSYFSNLAPNWYILYHVSSFDVLGINQSQYLTNSIRLNKMMIDFAEHRDYYTYYSAQNFKHSQILDKIYTRIGSTNTDPSLFRYEKLVEHVYNIGDYPKFDSHKLLCGNGPFDIKIAVNQFILKKQHREKISRNDNKY